MRGASGILFDLDGTLVDSGEDIASAVNFVRSRLSLEPLPLERVLTYVGDGARELLQRSLGDVEPGCLKGDDLNHALALWKDYYDDHYLDRTRPYPGIEELLASLGQMKLAVVSNKPESLVRRIVEELGWADRFVILVGGDTLPTRKPDPAPLLHAARAMKLSAERCVMIGDGIPDVAAGIAARMTTCAVTYGFVSAEKLAEFRPDYLVDSAAAILDLIRSG